VAGCMDYLCWKCVEAHGSPSMSNSSGGAVSASACRAIGLGIHDLQLGQVVFIQQNGCSGEPFELERAAHVVDMPVRDENLLQLEAQLGEPAMDAADFFTGSIQLPRPPFRRREWCSCIAAGQRKGLDDHEPHFTVRRRGRVPHLPALFAGRWETITHSSKERAGSRSPKVRLLGSRVKNRNLAVVLSRRQAVHAQVERKSMVPSRLAGFGMIAVGAFRKPACLHDRESRRQREAAP